MERLKRSCLLYQTCHSLLRDLKIETALALFDVGKLAVEAMRFLGILAIIASYLLIECKRTA